jgi:tRNA(Arg) A34 adenosine deaminase TadA
MDEIFLKEAVDLSQESVENGGYPVGAVVVHEGKVVGRGFSNGKVLCDATSHAEIAAIRDASLKLGVRNLDNCILYSSMEPCVMCLMACSWAYISKVCYACKSSKVEARFCEGEHDNEALNKVMYKPLEYVYMDMYEDRVLNIVNTWQESLKK